MSYVADTLSGAKYLSIQSALEESELNKEELERAMALGFVVAIEVGTTKFIERDSLRRYLVAQEEKNRILFEDGLISVPIKNKDQDVFEEALSRELAIEKRQSLVPAIIAASLAIVALLLAIPLPQEMESTRAAAAEIIMPPGLHTFFSNAAEGIERFFESLF